jgi:2'-5' RNA ligase
LSDDPAALVRVWLILPPDDVKRRIGALQESLRELDWVAAVPQHFLHVSAPPSAADWANVAPFPIGYRRVNCFHDAAIVEAHADGPFPPPPFLPHLSIGYFRQAERVEPLRDVLMPLRAAEFGVGVVEEAVLCEVPTAKKTFLEPWRVVERVRLSG